MKRRRRRFGSANSTLRCTKTRSIQEVFNVPKAERQVLGLYVVQSLFSSFALHWGQRSERGLSSRLWLAYIGYCVQFLHQCHLSKSLPLIYSTIQNHLKLQCATTDIFRYRLPENLVQVNRSKLIWKSTIQLLALRKGSTTRVKNSVTLFYAI